MPKMRRSFALYATVLEWYGNYGTARAWGMLPSRHELFETSRGTTPELVRSDISIVRLLYFCQFGADLFTKPKEEASVHERRLLLHVSSVKSSHVQIAQSTRGLPLPPVIERPELLRSART